MTTAPLVSVLIRTKDRKSLLQEALQSVLAQTWQSLEVIIINDGGEDFSAAVVPPKAGNVRWLDNPGPHGRSHAANLALATAAGTYCLFLDDDDSIDPEHLANLVAVLEKHPDHAGVYSAVRTLTDGVAGDTPAFGDPFDPVRLMIENYIPIHAVLFRRTLVDEGCRFDPAFDRFEDWDFWLQATEHHSLLFVDACTATYRVDTASGFGAKADAEDDMDTYRLALYRKWLPRWSDARLLALLDRSREYPRIQVFKNTADSLYRQLDVRNDQYHRLKDTMMAMHEQFQMVKLELDDTRRKLQEAQQKAEGYENYNKALLDNLQVIYNSKSWRLTRPFRGITQARYHLQQGGLRGLAEWIGLRRERSMPPTPPGTNHAPKHPVIDQAFTPLTFPACGNPRISIVIPCFNEHLYTFHCLKSILANLDDEAVEVIVVNDQSTDRTAEMLAGIKGIRVITNETNAGFIRSCNAGAAEAQGEFLVLLNNDTEVTPGWLGALRQTFTTFPDAGLVGARLVFADGTLQEAGGIVWQDGSAWNYGRGDDPNKPEYTYCRRADYCSGACLMLRLADFRALGGFDEHYLPAYYEDTDLAFRTRANGKQVYYQPRATVIHFEGVTSGTDLDSGTKQYQRINQDKFYQRWRDTLAAHRPNGRSPHLEKERHVGKRVLVIDARELMPDHDSGSLRMFNIILILQRLGYKVTFLPANRYFHDTYTPPLQALGVECQYAPYVNSVREYLQDWGAQFDAVILSRADIAARFIDDVKVNCPRAKVFFDTVDLHFLREQREAELSGSTAAREAAMRRKSQELGIARKADATLVVSPVELQLFREEAPDVDVCLLGNIHPVHPTAGGFADRRDMLFIGNFEHPPNTDAMQWFLDEIHPLVLAQNPAIRLHIVGGHVPERLKSRASDTVVFDGFISDIKPLFAGIRLSIAPLRYGAGVKGKINSSLSYGVPMVATSMAVEGMGLAHERDILVADSPADFAAQILRLYTDESLWNTLSAAGKENIEKHFSFAVAEEQLRNVLSR